MQPIFSMFKLFSSLTVALPIFAFSLWLSRQPNRWPGADRTVDGRAEPVAASPTMRVWRMTAPDRRFGGLSALAVDGAYLVALTDSGVVVRFAPPRRAGPLTFALHDLPAGPGSPLSKAMRDSESLVADPDGRGWWVGFETRHSLWLFDHGFTRVLDHHSLDVNWPTNRGGEAMMIQSGRVLVLPENGGRVAGARMVSPPWVSDATRLPDGRTVLLIRRLSPTGFAHQLRIAAGAGKPARRIALRIGIFDNLEGVAAQPLPGGGIRLWLVADDNFRPWMRSLLVSMDLPPTA